MPDLERQRRLLEAVEKIEIRNMLSKNPTDVELLLYMVEDNPGLSARALAEKLGQAPHATSSRLGDLKRKKLVFNIRGQGVSWWYPMPSPKTDVGTASFEALAFGHEIFKCFFGPELP